MKDSLHVMNNLHYQITETQDCSRDSPSVLGAPKGSDVELGAIWDRGQAVL